MKNILVIIAITATLAASAQVPSYVPTNGLVGYWPFNGNANDESGNGNDGMVNGATLTTDRFGNSNSAYNFDGDDWVQVSNSASLNFTDSNSYSISVLLSPDQYSPGQEPQSVIEKYTSGSIPYPYHVRLDFINPPNYTIFSGSYDGSASDLDLVQYSNISTTQWSHIVVIYSNNKKMLYLNGTLVDTDNFVNSVSPNSLDLFIGARQASTNRYFYGKIDDIGIWNRALTQCEIQDLYNAQLNSVNVSAGNDLTVCEGDEIVLSGSGADSYSWNNGVLDSIPFVATNTSEYVVVGIDTLGCLGTDTMQVNVLSTSSSSQNETSLDSYVWSVNGQTYTQSGTYTDTLLNVLGCDSIVTLNLDLNFTGIESDNNNEFNVFPNPVNELLTIINTSNASKNIKLIDKQGRLVLESIISKETNTINLAHLESGNYLLFIEGNDYPIQIIKK